jgi:hypothetical protein
MMARVFGVAVSVLCLTCPVAFGAALHVDNFESEATTLGWTGGASPTHIASGGPAGAGDAFLQITTTAFGHLATYTDAAEWTGDYAAIGAARITVDLMSPPTSAPLPVRVVLFGPSDTSNRWTSTDAQIVPNDGVWRTYTYGLASSDLTSVSGFATYSQMMANVVRMMLRFDPDGPDASGPTVPIPGGTLNIDNITLAAAAEPQAGDFNGDGTVNAADLTDPATGWKARFGTDLDGNDFLIWQRNLGAGAATTAASSVPEPRAWLMSLVLLSALVWSRGDLLATTKSPRSA